MLSQSGSSSKAPESILEEERVERHSCYYGALYEITTAIHNKDAAVLLSIIITLILMIAFSIIQSIAINSILHPET